MKRDLLLGGCACFLDFCLLCFQKKMTCRFRGRGAALADEGIPSLFPFLVACGILLRIGAAQRMGAALRPLMQPLFHLPGIAAFLLFGLLSGYPMGAKLTAQLYEQPQLSLADAQQLLPFPTALGPLFLIGTVGVAFRHALPLGICSGSPLFSAPVLQVFSFRKENPLHPSFRFCFPYQPLTVLFPSVADALRTIC